MIQGGAGTSTNMNANEVIANRALEILGHSKGEYKYLHPNDDVNCSQSTNDAYPTAIKLAVYFSLQDTLGALEELKRALQAKEQEFAQVLKMGRTENQDAVPITLGQEFGAYAAMIGSAMKSMRIASDELLEINMGATAIGTGINSPPGYAELVTKKIAAISGLAVAQGGKHGGIHPGLRRLLADGRQHEALGGAALQDLQRPALDVLRSPLRPVRDPAAGHAARLVDHAGQGQPGHPGDGQPGLLHDHRL